MFRLPKLTGAQALPAACPPSPAPEETEPRTLIKDTLAGHPEGCESGTVPSQPPEQLSTTR